MGEGDAAPGALSLDLVRRIQAGDEDAWERLYLRYRDRLMLAIRCRLGAALRGRIESEDILHSVVRDALDDLGRFEPEGPRALEHYFHACVANKIRSKAAYFGAARRAGAVALSESLSARLPAGDGRLRYADEDRFERLEKALEALPEDLREVILLRRIEGLSNQEAAAALGKSPEATSKSYGRAMARLALALGARHPAE